MTREEAENKISELIEQIRDVTLEYDHRSDYLSIAMTGEDLHLISFNNNCWEKTSCKQLERFWSKGGKTC